MTTYHNSTQATLRKIKDEYLHAMPLMGNGMAWSDERIENIVIPAVAENIMTM